MSDDEEYRLLTTPGLSMHVYTVFAGVEGSSEANANTGALLASESYSPKPHGLVP